ncbi:MAG TPA: class I SAM-dependent methyltransferase [Candidatus Saccharimonadales bacterium]|nr:class I SAM-dependent methyltransferase [Candidatus Saccharimonadales bacterium]
MSHFRQPSPFLKKFAGQLEPGRQYDILDVGCGEGDCALYLASLGHRVMGISNDAGDIRQARRRARQQNGQSCAFDEVDVRDLGRQFDRNQFSAVLAANVLHLMTKADSRAALSSMQLVTAARGLHGITGYLVDPALSTSPRNTQRMFRPGELRAAYDEAAWDISYSHEDPHTVHQHAGAERVLSHTEIIARKRP